MRKTLFAMALAAGCLCLTVRSADAFDGKRSGFILGFGLGGGYTHVSQTLTGTWLGPFDVADDKFGVASEFKIGAGVGERLQLYYANRLNWFSDGGVTFAAGVGLVGVSYYLEEQTPSFYLMGLVGLSTWDTPLEDGSNSSYGFGIGAGAGWEFARHFSLEATVNWGNPSDEEGSVKLETTFTEVLLTLNAIAY